MNAIAASAPSVEAPHFSWSQWTTFKTCPAKLAYKRSGQPVERTSSSLCMGRALHRGIEFMLQARMEGRSLPGLDEVLGQFDLEWADAKKAAPEIVFAKKENDVSVRETASRMFVAMAEHFSAETEPGTILGIENELKFTLVESAPEIHARVDLIEKVGADLLRVTDFKSSKNRWPEGGGDKLREQTGQLVVYGMGLIDLMHAVNAKKVQVRFVVVSKAKTPRVDIFTPVPTADDVRRLKTDLAETWDAITRGVFPRREGWWCKSCEFRTACQSR